MEQEITGVDLDSQDELVGFLRGLCHLVSLDESEVSVPADGGIVLGMTGVSLLWSSRPSPCWQVRETLPIRDSDGSERKVSRLIANVPEVETIRAAKVSMVLAFERLLDVSITRIVSPT